MRTFGFTWSIGVTAFLVLGTACAADDYWSLPVPFQGEAPAEHIEPIDDLSPEGCGRCHPKQLVEWSWSLHARAAGPGVLGQLPAFDSETQAACLACHAPRSEQQAEFLTADPGAVRSLSGVDCAACHVRHHRRHGPRSKPLTPHGEVIALPLFEQAAFCAPCHQFPDWGERVNGKLLENTEQEWLASPFATRGVSCQDCHMPDASHAFKGIHDPGMTRKAMHLDVRRNPEGITVRVRNTGAGHALPTYATPRIRVLLRATGTGHASLEHAIERRLEWDPDAGWTEPYDTRLLPGQTLDLALALGPAEEAEVTLFVEPDALYHELVYPSLEESIGEDLDPASLELLQEARERAGRSGYLLFRARCPAWQERETECEVHPGSR